jgi:hypothetical protein
VDPRGASDDACAVTVADDGEGFNSKTSGTGIGLKNVRERLRLRYAGEANLRVVANFPAGVAATITVPAQDPSRRSPPMSDKPIRHLHRRRGRALLRHALLVAELKRAWPDLRIVAECEDGASAVEAMAEHTVRTSPSSTSACPA